MGKKNLILAIGVVALFGGGVFVSLVIFGDSAFYSLFDRKPEPPPAEFALPVPLDPVEQASMKVALSIVDAEFAAKRAERK